MKADSPADVRKDSSGEQAQRTALINTLQPDLVKNILLQSALKHPKAAKNLRSQAKSASNADEETIIYLAQAF